MPHQFKRLTFILITRSSEDDGDDDDDDVWRAEAHSLFSSPSRARGRNMLRARHVFLTGSPGVGKTTLVVAAVKALIDADAAKKNVADGDDAQIVVSGFITEECREASDGDGGEGERVGFDVVTLPPPGVAAERAPFARRNRDGKAPPKGTPSVGKYAVDVAAFEALAVPAIGKEATRGSGKRARVTVIDEVGKMEMFSASFMAQVWDALDDASTNVLGKVPYVIRHVTQRGSSASIAIQLVC